MRLSSSLIFLFLVIILATVLMAEDGNDLQQRSATANADRVAAGVVDSVLDAYGRSILRIFEEGSIAPVYSKDLKDPEAFPIGELAGQEQDDFQSNRSGDIFHPYIYHNLDHGADALAIGDVTGDGLNDVVAITEDSIYVFPQTHTGELNPHVSYAISTFQVGSNLGSVDIADLNNDGRMDVIATMSGALGVLLQKTDGFLEENIAFATIQPCYNTVDKLRAGDFNNDGLTDIVALCHGVEIFIQSLTDLLLPPTAYNVAHGHYADLAIGDVNSDYLTDIIVMSGMPPYEYGHFGILIQNSAGTFDGPTYYKLDGDIIFPKGVAAGDVNGDGRDDIVISRGGNRPSSFINVFLQDDAGIMETALSLPSHDIPQPVEVADINLDGRKDVLTVHGGWRYLGVYIQDRDGSLMPEELYRVPYASHYNRHSLAVGDVNGDSKPDVAIAEYNHGVVILYNALEPTEESIIFDIKPGSCPNPLNLNGNMNHGKAILPTAIVGTSEFDVRDIDPSSVRLENVLATRWSYEDVAGPAEMDHDNCSCGTSGPDGNEDLTLKFARSDIIAGLGEANQGDTIYLEMTATLFGGGTVNGSDCVWICNNGKPTEAAAQPLISEAVLYENIPNPFNQNTKIDYALLKSSDVKLIIYDVLGRTVRVLIDERQAAGDYSIIWDGKDKSGQEVATGVYFYHLEAGNFVKSKKMLLLK
jgi:hypothetical protein